MKPNNKRIVSRRIKLLALVGGLVIIFLLVAATRMIMPVQLKTTVVPDPMAYFEVIQDGRNAHVDIKKQHTAVWIVRRSAFLPILDVSKVPLDLRNTAEAYNGEMSARLESAMAELNVSQPLRNRVGRMGNLVAHAEREAGCC